MNKKLIILLFTCYANFHLFAQNPTPVSMPDLHQYKMDLLRKKLERKPIKIDSTKNKPTGVPQRLIRTKSMGGTPGSPFYDGNEFKYLYSDTKATTTPQHGVFPVSYFDTVYSTVDRSYASQNFWPSGDLKQSFWYYDMGATSGQGAGNFTTKKYDERGLLILDSMRQKSSDNGNTQNLIEFELFEYNQIANITYHKNALLGLDPGLWSYINSDWTFYDENNGLPKYDSIIIVDDGEVTKKICYHYYDNSGHPLKDSIYWIGLGATLTLQEIYDYSYPSQNHSQIITYKKIAGLLKPEYRINIVSDNNGRTLLNQIDDYNAGQWENDGKYTQEFTFDSQPESLPTKLIRYLGNGNNWEVNVRETRTFNNQNYVDTLYDEVINPNTNPTRVRPNFVTYQYNINNNLTQSYTHNFLDDGVEISGYYTDYYYEEAPLAIGDNKLQNDIITIYPNPSKNYVSLNIYDGKNKEWIYIINSSTGKLCKQGILKNGVHLNIAELTEGSYTIVLLNKEHTQIGAAKFIKLRQ